MAPFARGTGSALSAKVRTPIVELGVKAEAEVAKMESSENLMFYKKI